MPNDRVIATLRPLAYTMGWHILWSSILLFVLYDLLFNNAVQSRFSVIKFSDKLWFSVIFQFNVSKLEINETKQGVVGTKQEINETKLEINQTKLEKSIFYEFQ